jgi:hypothetical protein
MMSAVSSFIVRNLNVLAGLRRRYVKKEFESEKQAPTSEAVRNATVDLFSE